MWYGWVHTECGAGGRDRGRDVRAERSADGYSWIRILKNDLVEFAIDKRDWVVPCLWVVGRLCQSNLGNP